MGLTYLVFDFVMMEFQDINFKSTLEFDLDNIWTYDEANHTITLKNILHA